MKRSLGANATEICNPTEVEEWLRGRDFLCDLLAEGLGEENQWNEVVKKVHIAQTVSLNKSSCTLLCPSPALSVLPVESTCLLQSLQNGTAYRWWHIWRNAEQYEFFPRKKQWKGAEAKEIASRSELLVQILASVLQSLSRSLTIRCLAFCVF